MRERRRLAAIVVVDLEGYSRLMGRDEVGTLARLKEHRAGHLAPALARNGGRLVKLMGDGALVEFGSALAALRAAIEFQQSVAEANTIVTDDSKMEFRVGIHLGDIIVDDDQDVYGDDVNIAARLEGKASSGGIVISVNIYDMVRNRLRATFQDLGDLSLKNIERPVRAFTVSWEAANWTNEMRTAAPEYTPMPEAVRRVYEALRERGGPSLEAVQRRAREKFDGSIPASCADGMDRYLMIYGEPWPSTVREPLSPDAWFELGYGSLRYSDDASKLVSDIGRDVWANLVVREDELAFHLSAIRAE